MWTQVQWLCPYSFNLPFILNYQGSLEDPSNDFSNQFPSLIGRCHQTKNKFWWKSRNFSENQISRYFSETFPKNRWERSHWSLSLRTWEFIGHNLDLDVHGQGAVRLDERVQQIWCQCKALLCNKYTSILQQLF